MASATPDDEGQGQKLMGR